jgi:ABC-type uncharacterized transport system permease subunit
MAFGPLVIGLGTFLIGRAATPELNYWRDLFPGIIMIGLGLSVTVAPLTSTILGGVDKARSGIASAVNNAVSRIAGLIAIALISSVAYSFSLSMYLIAALVGLGGIISAIGIRDR